MGSLMALEASTHVKSSPFISMEKTDISVCTIQLTGSITEMSKEACAGMVRMERDVTYIYVQFGIFPLHGFQTPALFPLAIALFYLKVLTHIDDLVVYSWHNAADLFQKSHSSYSVFHLKVVSLTTAITY